MPDPLIILCPLRSFSSVVCGMLGQHPDMYGMPELNLFLEDNLGALLQRHQRTRPFAVHGLLRALAQLHDGEQTEATVRRAQHWLEARLEWPTGRVFTYLADRVAPRILIDKSPATVMSPRVLRTMHGICPNASYLHLSRHPRTTGKSILELVRRNHEWNGPADPERVDPERLWYVAHRNIVAFTRTLPLGQSMRIKGEDLLSALDIYLPQIAEWLGVRTDPAAIEAMKHPETSPYACLGPANAQMGNDPNFLKDPRLRPARAQEQPRLEEELDWRPGHYFSRPTRKLAREFGYQ